MKRKTYERCIQILSIAFLIGEFGLAAGAVMYPRHAILMIGCIGGYAVFTFLVATVLLIVPRKE